jgi:hypothetical protein
MAQAKTLGLDPKLVKSKFLSATLDAAMASKSVDPISRALNSTQADGTPTWNPEEQATLLEAQHRMGTQFEAEARIQSEKTAHQTMGNWALDIAAGKLRLTPDMIRQANANGTLDPQYNDAAFSLQHQFDAEAQQKLSWQREAATYARTSAIQGMELQSMRAKRFSEGIIGSSLAAGMNGTQLTAALIAHRSSMDNEAFVDAMQFAKSIPSDDAYVQQTHAGDHLFELNDFLTKTATENARRSAVGQPAYSPSQLTTLREQATFAFFQNLRTGANPDNALRAALASTGVGKATIDMYANKASAKHATPNMSPSAMMRGGTTQ